MIFDHQKQGIAFLKKARYAMLGDEQGLGKTFQAIKAVEHEQGTKLIVCPAFLKGTWKSEIEKFTDDEDWVITSYDSMHKVIDGIANLCAVIFDESHYLKNMDAKRTKRAHSLVFTRKPKFCLLLSGTPVKNSCTEFYSPLKLLSYCPEDTNGSRLKEKSQYAFSVKFSNPKIKTIYRPGGREIQVTEYHGSRNLPELKEYLRGKYIRRLSKNVLNLPEIIDREINLDAPKKLLAGLEEAYIAFESGEGKQHFGTVKKEFALWKVKATCLLADDLITEGEQVVIFSDHVDPVAKIQESLGKSWKVGSITGATSLEDRDKIVTSFQSGELDCIVATIGAASTGFTLTAARNMIFNDIPWSYVDLAQARKRIHRVGQDKRCVVSFMIGGKVDQRILKKIKAKRENLEEAL